ncbi:class I SAM-dependent DNA methyltransferase, partial [Candidatus Saccharibacteria bacterium]|nr:class I SAM-dependent DNA methyltransferase [Candidatus Saccharibacteria bacterium]
EMVEGIPFLDNGFLSFSQEDYEDFINKEPEAKKWIKESVTGQSFINNEKRYCLWLVGISPSDLRRMPLVMDLVRKVKSFRLSSNYSKKFADTPWLFRETVIAKQFILVPKTSSENRNYLPMGFITDKIASNTSLMIPSASIYHFGILNSQMHMTWMRYVAGRLKSDYRYSKDIVYNNFPWPNPLEDQKLQIEFASQKILEVRNQFSNIALADLYNLLTMPPELLSAHRELDGAVDMAYRSETFEGDDDRIKFLFELYKKIS